ncbi:MAG TPA: T9SS type A sorting domain-containing protein [Bacteroidia bacterium]|nr:T9SS type A sorting domain-containing protein [Bacteroidia bacterium]
MRKITSVLILLLLTVSSGVFAQCSTTNATSCVCDSSGSTNCDLLPDMIVGRPPLLTNGSNGIIEYAQTGNGSNNGLLRISVSTPNIGHGPLEVRTTSTYVCGTDTFFGTSPGTCPNSGLPPKQLIMQRVYHKNGNVMTYTDRPAGSMTYHPSHGHMHVDDWGLYTLRTMDSLQSDPLQWPIVGTGAKLAFCLMDYGTCSTYAGHCVDSTGNILLNGNFPNFGLGGGSFNCSPVVQGISSGFTDIYYQYLDGMYITIPNGTCNGQYYIVVNLDPYNYFLEEDETNNVLVVPYTLTQQIPPPTAVINASGPGFICSGDSIILSGNSGFGYSYSWSTGATTQSITTQTAGIYTLTVTTNCGAAVSSPFTVSVSAQAAISPIPSMCDSSTSVLLTGGIPAGGTWSGQYITGNYFNPSAAGIGQHTVTYNYTDANSCSTSAQAIVSVNDCSCAPPAVPVKVKGVLKPCPGTAINYSTLDVNGATNYTWTVPQHVSIVAGQGAKTVKLAFDSLFVSGDVCVVAGNNCGTSAPRCKTVSANIPKKPGALSGTIYGNCSTPVSLSINPVSGATSYNWDFPVGATAITGQGTTSVGFMMPSGAASSQVCVTSYNGCANSAPRCIMVYSGPKKPPTILGPAVVCANQQNVTYAVVPVNGATTYLWGVPSGSTIVSGQGTNSIVVNFGPNAGYVACSARNVCGNNGTRGLAVTMNCRLEDNAAELLDARLQPNPASDYTELFIEKGSNTAEVTITNLIGKDLFSETYNISDNASIKLDLAGFSKGFYLVTIHSAGKAKTLRLVVE